METKNRIKLEVSLNLGKKTEIKTKKIFYGSVFFIFLSVLGALFAWFLKIIWQKTTNRLKALKQALTPEFSSPEAHLRVMFLLVAINLSFWGWLNKNDIFLVYEPWIKEVQEIGFPIAMGKMEEGLVLGEEDAVKINDLQKELVTIEKPLQKFLGSEKDPSLSLTEERCQKNMAEKKSSELCGKYEKDKVLEQELKKIDDQAKAKMMAARKPIARKVSCAEANDHPSYSDTKGKHVDEDCCPDPDEWPKPGCSYSPAGYALMLKR